jgi:hypothetical protein
LSHGNRNNGKILHTRSCWRLLHLHSSYDGVDWVFGLDAIIGPVYHDERGARHESLSIPADGDLRQRGRVTSHGRWHAAEAPVRPGLARLLCLCRVGNDEMRWARIRRGISIMPTASQPAMLLVCMHAYALVAAAVASCQLQCRGPLPLADRSMA